ncbi:MAG: TonB-dependent siderophore receptor [Terriglobales bacterium]
MSQTRIRIKKHKNRAKARQRGARYWMALGTMAAYTTFSGDAAFKLYAQQDRPTPALHTSGQTQGLTVRRFDIPPGTLGAVLAVYQRTAQFSVIVPQDSMREIWSPGVAGLYTPLAALQKLLAGTGIGFKLIGPDKVTLEVQGMATAINVTAPGLQDSLPKLTQPLVDTPQSIDIVPQHIIQDQGATTLRDALRNVAGISLAAGEGGAQGDNLTIRGFTARNDIFLDGMRDFGSYYRDPFDMQEVAVLQGPSSVTFGRGSTGGVVNQETKVAQLDPLFTGEVEFGTDQTKRITADIDRPLPSLGSGTAFRLDLMAHDSKFAGRDIAENRRYGIAPSLAFGLGTPTRFTLSYLHQGADDRPDYGIPWLFNGPAPVDRRNYYGFEHGNYLKTNVDMGTVKFEHDFSNSISLRNQARYAHYHRDVRITEAQIDATTLDATDPLATPLSQIDALRNQITVDSTETFLQDQTDLTMRFRTGPLRHTLVTGAEGGRETSSPYRQRFDLSTVPETSLLHPDTSQAFAGTVPGGGITDTHVTAISVGAYALDTVSLLPKLDVTAGVRVDRFDATVNQSLPVTPASPFKRVDVMPSWRGALVYKPVAGASIYFDYGTSFNPSAETLALTVATQDAPPEANRTFEVGTKWDLYSRKLSLRAAAFRTDKTNARETVNATTVVLSGSQQVNGFQFQANGYLTSRWEVLASYAYLDGFVTKSVVFPLSVGAQLANVPKNTFSTWSNFQLPWRLSVGGGADFVDRRTASSTTPIDPVTGLVKRVPGYWVFNAMAKYPLSEHVELRANVYNLADKYYYDQIHPAHIVPGAARSALLGINFKF